MKNLLFGFFVTLFPSLAFANGNLNYYLRDSPNHRMIYSMDKMQGHMDKMMRTFSDLEKAKDSKEKSSLIKRHTKEIKEHMKQMKNAMGLMIDQMRGIKGTHNIQRMMSEIKGMMGNIEYMLGQGPHHCPSLNGSDSP